MQQRISIFMLIFLKMELRH